LEIDHEQYGIFARLCGGRERSLEARANKAHSAKSCQDLALIDGRTDFLHRMISINQMMGQLTAIPF
jgi:hypothetical protein